MSQESDTIEQQQEEAAFSAGFNSVRPSDDYEPPEEEDGDTSDQQDSDDSVRETDQEPEAFSGAGMTASQIKELLLRTTRFEEQLGKAHGKIGELNRTVQELRSVRHADAQADNGESVSDDDADQSWEDVEDVFPGLTKRIADRARKEALAAFQSAVPQQADQTDMLRTMAVSVMDATQPGWRETVQSDDFSLWIATQPEEVRETFNTTVDVGQFTTILRWFGDSRTTPAGNKNKRRLESAITPDARASKVHRGMTDEQAFQYGFESVRKARNF